MQGRSHVVVNVFVASASVIGLCSLSESLTGISRLSEYTNTIIAGLVPKPLSFYNISVPYPWDVFSAWFICYLSLIIGSLLPDIDSRSSALGKVFHLRLRHRTWTHSIWALILLFVMCFGNVYARWLFFGYFLHILCDSFSSAGVCLLYPLTKYRKYSNGAFVAKGYHLKLYRTNKFSEGVFVGVTVAVSILMFIYFGFGDRRGFYVLLRFAGLVF